MATCGALEADESFQVGSVAGGQAALAALEADGGVGDVVDAAEQQVAPGDVQVEPAGVVDGVQQPRAAAPELTVGLVEQRQRQRHLAPLQRRPGTRVKIISNHRQPLDIQQLSFSWFQNREKPEQKRNQNKTDVGAKLSLVVVWK